MPRPTRTVPRVGAKVRIAHFGGERECGTVVGVEDDGRRLEVLADGGETLQFVLSPATARFVSAGSGQGPRLELLGDAG
jgi:phage gp45-like